jgi:DNA-binding NtrC family response regulator
MPKQMKVQKHNINILGNDTVKLSSLRKFLLNNYSKKVNVSLYFSIKSFFRVMHNGVDLVILDGLNEKGWSPEKQSELLKSIKVRFPETEVIIHTSNDDVSVAVESMRSGAKDYIIKDNRSWLRIGLLIDRIVAQPTKALVAEWGVMKFTGWLLLIFLIVSSTAVLVLM